MNLRGLARNVEHRVRLEDSEIGMAFQRVKMLPLEFVARSSHMIPERLVAVTSRVRQDGDFRMGVKEVFTALIVIEAGHQKNHSVGEIEIVRADHRMKKRSEERRVGTECRSRRSPYP